MAGLQPGAMSESSGNPTPSRLRYIRAIPPAILCLSEASIMLKRLALLLFGGLILAPSVFGQALAQPRCDFNGHEGVILALGFSPDGQLLASGSTDTTVLIWPVAPAPQVAGQPGFGIEQCWGGPGQGRCRKGFRRDLRSCRRTQGSRRDHPKAHQARHARRHQTHRGIDKPTRGFDVQSPSEGDGRFAETRRADRSRYRQGPGRQRSAGNPPAPSGVA